MQVPLPKNRLTMEDLPLPILQLICESIAYNDTQNRRTVRAIALTSKHCCAAIDRERFKHVRLVFWSRPDFEVAIKRWTKILRLDDRFRHVRCLSIIEKTERWTNENADTYKTSFLTSTPTDLHRVFTALTALTSKCVALKDLSWESDEPVSTMLLDMMAQQRPRVRLHVNPFNLKSLIQSRDNLHDIAREDYSLATSPNLHSINLTEGYFTGEGDIDYNGDAMPFWVSGMAPNLRCVDVCHIIPGNTPDLVQALRMPRPRWQGPFKGVHSSDAETKGQVRQLTLRGNKLLRRVELQKWSQVTDFSVLTSLTLMIAIEPVAVSDLSDMAEKGVFRCLESLSIDVEEDTGAHRLIATLPPLQAIAIFNEPRELWGYIIQRHGKRLRALRLTEPLGLKNLIWLRCAVPELRNLNISMIRCSGDAEEVRCYEQLGKFPKLQQLTLRLSFSGPMELFADYLAKEKSRTEDEVQKFRHVFTNIAIDDRLAREVFRTVLNASQATRPGCIPHFSSLELCPGDDREEADLASYRTLRSFMARSWLCERRHTDIHSEDVWITETNVHARNVAREDLQYLLESNWIEFEEETMYELAWKAQWPQARDKEDWLEEWHSCPLWQESESVTAE